MINSAYTTSTLKHEIDPQRVAEALVERLLAGHTFFDPRELRRS